MAQGKRKRIRRGRKGGKIRITQRARIVEKNDATRVQRADTTVYPRMIAQMPRSNGMVLKVKVKRK